MPPKASRGSTSRLGCLTISKKIEGIGPKLEQKLNEVGVHHYWQIAKMTNEEMLSLDKQLKLRGRIEREKWVERAKKLVGQDEAVAG